MCSDALHASFVNMATCVGAGLVVFAAVGYMSEQLDIPIDKVISDRTSALLCCARLHAVLYMPET